MRKNLLLIGSFPPPYHGANIDNENIVQNWNSKILNLHTLDISNKNKSFKPNYFVDITKSIKFKLKALRYYKREMRKWPHPRSIEGVKLLSKTRGSSVGLSNAEAFILGRHVEKNI